MDLSIVVPLYNEDESLPELTEWIHRVCTEHGYSYEVILVDDGSTDRSWEVIQELRSRNPQLKGIRFQRNYGKSAALNEGFKAAGGDVIITMDADLQDSPDEIPELHRMIKEDGFDLVSGWKKKRYDNKFTKNLPSKLFNAATRRMSKIHLHDFNCGLKAYRRKVVKSVEVYGEMHRYIPVLAKWAGFRKIGEKVVEHRARKYGVTKFGWERFVNGFLDLLSISFVGKFSKRPMHFFGLWGTVFFLLGFITTLWLIIGKIANPNESPLTNKPGFYLALAFVLMGLQLFLAGFVSELVARNAPGRNSYLIEEKTGI
ncbi:MAG: glycosyltransferase [Chitinophagaceae bacterium]|nr:MAG: glycosyltransferase [Chitinophagaceae bacterium]